MNDLKLITNVFFAIVLTIALWNGYVAWQRQRKRMMRLTNAQGHFDIGVCSSHEFTRTAVRLTLDGLRAMDGAAVRTSLYLPGNRYDAVLLDVAHPCDELPVEGAVGVYVGRKPRGVVLPMEVVYELRRDERQLCDRLRIIPEDVEVPKISQWSLVAAAILLIAIVIGGLLLSV